MWYSGFERTQKNPVPEWDEDSGKCQEKVLLKAAVHWELYIN